MARYRYAPLIDAGEIRVLILEPSRDETAPLRGSLKLFRLETDASPSFSPESLNPTNLDRIALEKSRFV